MYTVNMICIDGLYATHLCGAEPETWVATTLSTLFTLKLVEQLMNTYEI